MIILSSNRITTPREKKNTFHRYIYRDNNFHLFIQAFALISIRGDQVVPNDNDNDNDNNFIAM